MICAFEVERPYPPDDLGAATYRAAQLVDQLAVELLGACGRYDRAADRLARVDSFLKAWPDLERAVQELAGASSVLHQANDNQPCASSA